MKTIEEKAKRYDEALERARKLQENSNGMILKKWLWNIFPELKENEDGRIRKEIITHCRNTRCTTEESAERIAKWIAWLEKQGEQKPANKAKVKHLIPQKGMYYTCIKDYYSSDNTHLCVKGNIYKSFFNGYIDDESHLGLSWTNSCAEKYFEPTKDEDWIVCEHDNVIGKPMQYKEFKKKVNQKFIENLKAQGLTPKLRLWNLKDAKDGDVLFHSDSASNGIFIFKEIIDKGFAKEVICYCDYDSEDHFCLGEHHTCCWTDAKILYPATKEQRDTLFAKMKEAGYTFDFEKKELKKLGQPEVTKTSDQVEIAEIPFGAKDSELQEATYFIPKGFHAEIDDDKVVIKKGEKHTAWSEENRKRIQRISDFIWKNRKGDTDDIYQQEQDVKWLKSLKDRVGCKANCITTKEWSEEDEHRVKDTIYFLDTAKKHYASTVELDACIDWLKSLKQRIGG